MVSKAGEILARRSSSVDPSEICVAARDSAEGSSEILEAMPELMSSAECFYCWNVVGRQFDREIIVDMYQR